MERRETGHATNNNNREREEERRQRAGSNRYRFYMKMMNMAHG
jgi:hypothetical protein